MDEATKDQTMYAIFVINLDAQKRRWAFMQRQLDGLGLTPIRLPAVNGYDPETRSRARAASYALLPGGEIGCFESHRNAWAEIVRRDLPGAFVLEDDVVVASDFAALDLPPELLARTDVIKLDTCRWTAAYGPVTGNPAPGRELRPLWGSETSAGCYYMTRRGAEKMLRLSENYFLPVDTLMFNLETKVFHQLTTLKVLPAIAAQLRFIMPKEELATEIAYGMQEKRRLNHDPWPTMTIGLRLRLYLRRLLDWDFGLIRKRRRDAFLRNHTGGLPPAQVDFVTGLRDHIDTALPLLDETPS